MHFPKAAVSIVLTVIVGACGGCVGLATEQIKGRSTSVSKDGSTSDAKRATVASATGEKDSRVGDAQPANDGGISDAPDADSVDRQHTPIVDCDDAVSSTRFQACVEAKDEDSCKRNCGDWQRAGYANSETCICKTGQGTRSCTSHEECLGKCVADSHGSTACSDMQNGTCAETAPLFGCWCWFGGVGNVTTICLD